MTASTGYPVPESTMPVVGCDREQAALSTLAECGSPALIGGEDGDRQKLH
jgi:hypothetical protein